MNFLRCLFNRAVNKETTEPSLVTSTASNSQISSAGVRDRGSGYDAGGAQNHRRHRDEVRENRTQTMAIENLGAKFPGPLRTDQESLFERCSWFYAFCREHLFRDHTTAISQAFWPGARPGPDTRLLEIACGPGFYACSLAQRYPDIQMAPVSIFLIACFPRARRTVPTYAVSKTVISSKPTCSPSHNPWSRSTQLSPAGC